MTGNVLEPRKAGDQIGETQTTARPDDPWHEAAVIIYDELRPGIELLQLQGVPGYETEHLILSNSLSNGLRFQLWEDASDDDDSTEIAHFHVMARSTALLIAARLTSWANRIADPPDSTKISEQ